MCVSVLCVSQPTHFSTSVPMQPPPPPHTQTYTHTPTFNTTTTHTWSEWERDANSPHKKTEHHSESPRLQKTKKPHKTWAQWKKEWIRGSKDWGPLTVPWGAPLFWRLSPYMRPLYSACLWNWDSPDALGLQKDPTWAHSALARKVRLRKQLGQELRSGAWKRAHPFQQCAHAFQRIGFSTYISAVCTSISAHPVQQVCTSISAAPFWL